MNDTLSIIYPTRNRSSQIKHSLEALLNNSLMPLEIIIVDQSSNSDTENLVKQMNQPLIHYIKSEETGLSRARNCGIKASQGHLLGFIDDDCIPANNWIDAALQAVTRFNQSSIWVGEVYTDAYHISSQAISKAVAKHLSLAGKNDPWRLGPTGGNAFFRKEVFTQLGYFDPVLGQGSDFPGAEDGDMLYRVLKKGQQVTYTDSIRAYHTDWRDDDEELKNAYNHGMGVGAMLAKFVSQGDFYPVTVIFARNFLIRFLAIPFHYIRGNTYRLQLSKNWAKSITLGFIGWFRYSSTTTKLTE